MHLEDLGEIRIVVHKDADNCYRVTVESLPGCFSAGDTLQEALVNTAEAIACHLDESSKNSVLVSLDAVRRLQSDKKKVGVNRVHLYFEDADGDWLENWHNQGRRDRQHFEHINQELNELRDRQLALIELLKKMEADWDEQEKSDHQLIAIKAVSASVDARTRKIKIIFNNGSEFVFLADKAEGLFDAAIEDLTEIEITPSGMGLHWSRLDVDLGIFELMHGVLGSKKWMNRVGDRP